MYELLRNFQSRAIVESGDRNLLLRKLTAAAIAYSSPLPIGELGDAKAYFRQLVAPSANKIIDIVNSKIVIDTDGVMADVRNIWMARYELVNSPVIPLEIYDFHKSLSTPTGSIVNHFNAWISPFSQAVKAKLEGDEQ